MTDSDGAKCDQHLIGVAPWSMAVDHTSSAGRKIQPFRGSGGLPPRRLPHRERERGVTLAISTPAQKIEGISQKIELFSSEYEIFLNTPPFTMIAAAPEGSPPLRISNMQLKKPPPVVPRRGPEAGSDIHITIFLVRQ